MFDQMKELLEEAAKNTGMWDAMAQCLKAQHDAMVRAGFTPDQAMDYLMTQGLAVKQN